MSQDEREAVELLPFPAEFPHKGEYRTYASDWTPTGYSAQPQYTGQMPTIFPTDATPFECFLGGYLRSAPAPPDDTTAKGRSMQ